MSFRFYNPAPVFMDLLGLAPLAGGSLQFFAIGTTTPKGTWSDSELMVANPNPVPLDSSGRANVNIWGDGAYTVRATAADGTSVWTRDVDSGAGAGATIPALLTGKFLTNDGSNLIWADVLQVPDPTGSANKILGTDGSNLIWQAAPTIPDLPVENHANRVKIGTLLIQWGASQAPATGQRQTGVAVPFPFAFSGAPYHVDITVTSTALVSSGVLAVDAVPTKDANGCSVQFDTNDFGNNASRFVNPVPFTWVAYGPTT
ncbi:gp53-like domain-containing protein [Xanthomonas sp. WHRI 7945]|nr:hypothetical protein [Xanthomonas campestris pv. campestris]